MERFKLLLEGIENNRHLEVNWILSMLTVSDNPFSDEMLDWKPYDIAVDRKTNKRVFFDPVNDNTFTAIEGLPDLAPIIDYKEIYRIKPGELPNVTEVINATGGTIIANLYLAIVPFKDKIPFVNRKLKAKDFNTPVAKMLATDVITIDEFIYYCECVDFLGNFWGVAVPTGSKKTQTISPQVLALKEKLLKEYSTELENNVVMTQIEKQLCDLDAQDFKGDVAEDFFVSSKSRMISRKKAKIIQGLDDGMGGSAPRLITSALDEGLDATDIPAGADSTRAASYSRGFLTAQGGELVNYLYRVFMNTKIASDDCGTKLGIEVAITKDNMKRYIDRYMVSKEGKTTLIDATIIASLVGKTITVRSPARCKEKAPNFCGRCTDKFFFNARETVHIETSNPGSIIMNDRMKAMHGRTYSIAFFEPTMYLT